MLRRLQHSSDILMATAGVRSRARQCTDAESLARPTGPPSTRTTLGELGSALDAVRLVGAWPRLSGASRGDGHLVVDIPGWRAPELSGAPLRRYLRRLGYDARGWGFGTNTGDPRRDVARLAERLLKLAEEKGSPASLIGWSLGGVIAREVARRHPEAVRRVITFGTPVAGGAAFTSIARAYGQGADIDAERVARRLDAETPIRVPLTVMFSRRDGIVAWQACIDHSSPFVEHIEVSSTHIGMGIDPDVWQTVADRLGAAAAAEKVSVDTPRLAVMTTTPDVITRYYAAAANGDLDALLNCFTPEAHVLDENQHYQGITEIRRWREGVASRYTYTTEITGTSKAGDDEYVVATHLEGDFPGGVVDLEQRFTVSGGLISDLVI